MRTAAATGAGNGPSIGDRIARLRAVIGTPADHAVAGRFGRASEERGTGRQGLARPAAPFAPALRGHHLSSGAPLVAPEGASSEGVSAGPSLAERLERARAGRSAGHAHAVEALCRATGAVPCGEHLLCVETRLPLPRRHGRTLLAGDANARVGVPLRFGETIVRPTGDLLLLDTETSGLAGGAGTFAFLLGLARVEGVALVVRQYLATRFAGESAMLDQLRQAVATAGCIVTFNGKSFDIPLLAGRYALRREAHPFGGLPHCDLLHASRRHLRTDWPDCRLRTAEERALGFERVDDLPGSEVPAVWQQWITRGNAVGLPRVLLHNREDLISLLALVQVLGTAEGRLPLFSGRACPHVPETGENALHRSRLSVQRVLQDPREVEVLV